MGRKKASLSYDDLVRQIQSLAPEQQLSLVEIISARLKNTLSHPISTADIENLVTEAHSKRTQISNSRLRPEL